MQTTYLIAFLAGTVSVFSPCILPIIPGYFAFMSGQKLNKPIIGAILFCIGFSMVFITFGAVIGTLGQFLSEYKRPLEIVGGIVIIIFAIQTSGIYGKQKSCPRPTSNHITNYNKSFFAGMIFALAGSPCYGPILGSIFTLALAETSFTKGLSLFGVYSLGMAVTFILIASLATKTSKIATKTSKFGKYFKTAMSVLLLILGIYMISGNSGNLANIINNLYTEFSLNIF